MKRRRRLGAVLIVIVAAAVVAMVVVVATWGGGSSSTLTVVGTSDVLDSNLVQAVLKPDFEAAYPQYTLNYVAEGSGAAIATAESGAASALVVHAASLENQFVAGGYSAEKYGRAIFYGDYVLLGPVADPAGVLTNAPHDVVTAFERIAAAGEQGQANFVSRGGTPGTTVEEHQIWSLASGVPTCTVDSADGGGSSPSQANGSCPSTIAYPRWYHATGLDQGPNVESADVCNYTGGNCYVLTDRGTFEYLESTGAIHALHIVTRDNSASARGGDMLLVNSFHAYAINPAKFASSRSVRINLPAATAFLDWVTSPAGQADVARFMASSGDPPFIPDAAPKLTATVLPAHPGGSPGLAVAGSLTNVVPGTPPLADVRITLSTRTGGERPRLVATTTTDARGRYRMHYRPTAGTRYMVSSPRITQVENSSLDPVFGDLLQSTAAAVGAPAESGDNSPPPSSSP